ncbi:lipid-A-disaccharide synthase [Cecembia sp.]|uniref:lipid-A-disaccharide synthase n=2 Tax=Cecembia sp. TaxID=1898110 RepID=UPI0025C6E05B|nr:lipid-A-disaccharide synthase [Cecembia sp.]
MRYYIISGERSGDMHAANLIKAIHKSDPAAQFRGMAGDYCQAAGMDLTTHYEEVAMMGFLEVVFGFRKVIKNLRLLQRDLLAFNPDVLILVDFGGFNMKMAAFAKKKGIPVHYYIPPKVWAWNQSRVYKIRAFTDKVYCILPFEEPFFKKFSIDATYVGNPLMDEIQNFQPHPFFHQKNELSYKPIIALLPGSRKQEVENMLLVMLDVVAMFPNAQFVVAGVSNIDQELYKPAEQKGIKVVFNQTYDLLHHAIAAVVTSGTATLETALFRVPQVVVYKTSYLSYLIGKRLVKIKYISLVNLIADREVVKELIQDAFNAKSIIFELNQLLGSIPHKAKVLDGYTEVKRKIGDQSASLSVSKILLDCIDKK